MVRKRWQCAKECADKSTSLRIRGFHAKAPVALSLRISHLTRLTLREHQQRPLRQSQVHFAARAAIPSRWNKGEDRQAKMFSGIL
jgi:hypothetical protein